MKKLGILLVVLIVLIGGYLLLKWYSQPAEFVPPADFKISEWTEEKIDEIRLVFDDEKQVVVKKVDENWQVNEKKADASRLTQIFDAFKEIEVTSRVSTNSQNHDRFEVDNKGMDLSLVSNDEVIQQLIVGKSAGGNNVYARLPEQDDVYVVANFPLNLLAEDISIWRDKQVVKAEVNETRMVRYQAGSSTWQVSRTSDGWALQLNSLAPIIVDSAKVESWLTSVTGLNASGFPDEDSTLGRQLGVITVETGTVDEFSEKEEISVHVSDEEDQVFFVNGDVQFLVLETTFDSIYQTYSELVQRFKIEEQPEDNSEE